MDARAEKIRSDLDAAQQARLDAQSVQSDYEARLADAKTEASRLIDEARVAADQLKGDLADRADLLGRPDARLVLQNEEHGVFALDDPRPQIGDYLLAVPGHVCPTTVHYPGSHVIDDRGNVCGYWEHTARDR